MGNTMKKFVEKAKPFVKPAVVASVIWLLLNVSTIQGWFFKDAPLARVVLVKFLHLIFLFLLVSMVFFIVRKSKQDERYKDLIKIAAVYFGILMVLLILVWPGAWAWDDLGVIRNAQFYNFTPWQHFLSGLFQVLALQTLPFASGVIIIQAFLAAMMVGYVVTMLDYALVKKYKWHSKWTKVALIVPFLFLPVLYYVLTGYRMAVYQYLEILLFVMVLAKSITKEKLTYQWLVGLGFLTILVGAWRTEGLLIVFVVPVMLYLLRDKYLTKKRILVFFGVTLGGILVIGKINTAMIGNDNYKIGAIIYPLVVNIRSDEGLSYEDKDTIDKVLDLDCVNRHPELTEELIYHACTRSEYTDDEYSAFFGVAVGTLVSHLDETIPAIWNMYWRTSAGAYDEGGSPYARTTAVTAANIFTEGTPEKELWDKVDSKKKLPLNNELRMQVINILAGTPDFKATPFYVVFWNHIIPEMLIVVVIVIAIIRREWLLVVAGVAIVGRVGIVALTAMAPYFMYYMPVYVSSYVLFVFTMLELLNVAKSKKHDTGKSLKSGEGYEGQEMKYNYARIKSIIKSSIRRGAVGSSVTVVVPVHNGEDTIGKCLDSLMGQTLVGMRVVCVNDGSTDETLRILRRYRRKNWGIKIINQQNGGRSVARNVGLGAVKTEYVMFCDDDDYYDPEMCRRMIDAVNDSGADVGICGIKVHYQAHDEMAKSDEEYYRIDFEGKVEVDDQVIQKTDVSVCNKIFRMSIVRDSQIDFPVGLNNEDFYFWNAYVSLTKTAYFIKDKLYNYVRHQDSIMSSNFEAQGLSLDHLLVANRLFDFYKKTGFLKEHLNLFWRQWIASFWFSYEHSADKYRWRVKEKAEKFLKKNYEKFEPSDKELQQWKKDIDDALKDIRRKK